MTARRRLLPGSLGARLALAFLLVALGALVMFAALVLYRGSQDVAHLTREQERETADAVTAAATAAYARAHTWPDANLDAALALAAEGGANLRVLDARSRAVAGEPDHGSVRVEVRPVVVDGARVGTVRVSFPADDNPAAVRHLRDALLSTVAAAAGLAAVLALVVAVLVARRLTRPLTALTEAARAVERGDLDARVGPAGGRGEVRELVETFDHMAEALGREDRLRRALVADVAHEVRTPLTTLRATLEGLVDGVVAPDREQMQSLHDDVLRLSRVVDDLQSLAAAESAPLHLHFGDVDLAALAEEAVRSLRPQLYAAGIGVEVHAQPVGVRGDAERLRQVVVNLLTNALKFTPAGGRVTVEVEPDGADARLSVRDTGVGIPADEQAHVFERFWRGSAARGIAGSGIGLTIVDQLVRAHGGTVAVESAPNRGTCVTIRLRAQDLG